MLSLYQKNAHRASLAGCSLFCFGLMFMLCGHVMGVDPGFDPKSVQESPQVRMQDRMPGRVQDQPPRPPQDQVLRRPHDLSTGQSADRPQERPSTRPQGSVTGQPPGLQTKPISGRRLESRPGSRPESTPFQANIKLLRAQMDTASTDRSRLNIIYNFSTQPSLQVPPDSLTQLLDILEVSAEMGPLKQAVRATLESRVLFRSSRESTIYYAEKAANLYAAEMENRKYMNELIFISTQYRRLRKPVEAEEVLLRAIDIAQETFNDPQSLSVLYVNMGIMYSSVLANDLAVEMFTRAAELDADPNKQCSIVHSLAMSLNRLNNYEEAIRRLTPCLKSERVQQEMKIQLLFTMGQSMLQMGDTLQAVTYMQSSLDLTPPIQQHLITGRRAVVGTILMEADEEERTNDIARKLQQDLRRLPSSPMYSSSRRAAETFLMTWFLKNGQLDEALQWSDDYLSRLPEPLNHPDVGPVHEIRSQIFSELGDTERALESSIYHIQQMKWVGRMTQEREEAEAKVRMQLRMYQASVAESKEGEQSAKNLSRVFFVAALVAAVVAVVLRRRYRMSRDEAEDTAEKLSLAERETARLKEMIKQREKQAGLSQAGLSQKGQSQGGAKVSEVDTSNEASKGQAKDLRLRKDEGSGGLLQFKEGLQLRADSIMYLTSEGNYVVFVTSNENQSRLKERITLKRCEEILPELLFKRIHRAVIVNLSYIERINGTFIYMKNGDELKISRALKKELLELESEEV